MSVNGGGAEPIDVPVINPEAMAWYELNDLGNARRIIDLAQGKLLWCEDHWIAFDGARWSAEDGERRARLVAHDMSRHIAVEAEALDGAIAKAKAEKPATVEMIEERQTALFKHGVKSGEANKTTAALAQAKSDITARRDDFDPETLALNVSNGTLRFVLVDRANVEPDWFSMPPVDGAIGDGKVWAAKLDPHDPHDRVSRMAGVAWKPDAAYAEWAKHIETVLPDPAVRRFFQACCGYAITGEISEQCIFLLQGKGGDGKSTTMDVIREVMGEYAKVAGVESFLHGAVRSGAEASPDMARLGGDTRVVCTSEPRIGAALDEGRIKQITGGQPISARELHGAPFEYRPRFAVFFECNRKPRISGDDDGIWRRIIVIQFPHQFKGALADKGIFRRLLGEGEGVLRWLIEGTLIWLAEGLVPPDTVQAAIDDYRRSSNPFGEWFQERVDTRDPATRERASDLYDNYKKFCEENAVTDREIMSSTAFGRALGDKQLMKMKGADGKVLRKGCRLRGDSELALAAKAQGDAGGPEQGAPEGWD